MAMFHNESQIKIYNCTIECLKLSGHVELQYILLEKGLQIEKDSL